MIALLRRAGDRFVLWVALHSGFILRAAMAMIYFWFGILKPLNISPAADLVRQTFSAFDGDVLIPILGYWEMLIAVSLLYRPLLPWAVPMLFVHLVGTLLPLLLIPEVCFSSMPFGLSLEGQYIVKNVLLFAAGIVVVSCERK